ncbi:hypothetical protein CYY_003417 [Polysphondylium violaceum]|uniref:NADH dehydrogenase [ubiquinone] 1 alpha subcomplex subunit 13 n=1 Tax=Polysphondylium violaceum TaxID=133409 RepID=A0A8J4PUS9_9MYCE|nr:hypothetical protein CYY_003417 [Polysphondylium violaceum]
MTINYRQRWVQDLPPVGGYPKIHFGRRSPPPVSGYWMFGVTFALMGVGHYIFLKDKIARIADEEEENRRLTYILPIIQAENDINFLASPHKNVYHTRYMPPQTPHKRTYAALPKRLFEEKH